MSKTALIIVDVQYDFLPPSGALAVPDGNQIIPRIKDLLSTDNGTGKWRSVIATQVRLHILSDDACLIVGLSPKRTHIIRIVP